ncbi:zinc finger CCCH domain-containing protein 12-like [Cynara cardunculus var. scolymus]|uniref:Zinc finger, CCCH-type n=1 Tax=Cynara cardunculus var. scolymus TaxID=59895 RepID=A0A103XJ38_CYNCS|nr:zinc finger CCCH domain-containing protein 12-like [Cynara cardunculus var. scolymus]KVH91710.1 Zinc finger, CCCH-type [Cynara cardunculus var. scolymus]
MNGGRDGRNIIHIIGGHGPRRGADNRDDQPVSGREEFEIPSLGSPRFIIEKLRSSRVRHCRKFSSEEGCPFGDKCTYLHDDKMKGRERTAILLGPGSSVGYGNGGATGSGSGTAAAPPLAPPPLALPLAAAPAAAPLVSAASNSTVKPSWKTKICYKWERTGNCPYGSKCIFAHGAAELHRYGGGLLVDDEANPNQQVNVVAATRSSVAHVGGSGLPPATSERPVRKWKGPDKISRIYGDWIDDLE